MIRVHFFALLGKYRMVNEYILLLQLNDRQLNSTGAGCPYSKAGWKFLLENIKSCHKSQSWIYSGFSRMYKKETLISICSGWARFYFSLRAGFSPIFFSPVPLSSSFGKGSEIMKVEPSATLLLADIKPLCFSTIFLQSARPIPVPSNSVLRWRRLNIWKICSAYFCSNPIPLSSTYIRQ